MADQDAAPTLSSSNMVSRPLDFRLEKGLLPTGRIQGIGYLFETDETNDARDAHAGQSLLAIHSMLRKSRMKILTIHPGQTSASMRFFAS